MRRRDYIVCLPGVQPTRHGCDDSTTPACKTFHASIHEMYIYILHVKRFTFTFTFTCTGRSTMYPGTMQRSSVPYRHLILWYSHATVRAKF